MRLFQPPPRRGNAAAFFAPLILLVLVPNASWGGFEPDRVSQNGRETHLASVPRGADDLVLMNEIVRLTRFDALGSVLGEEQHTQDSNGNRIQEGELRLFWDSFDRLVRVERTSDGVVVGRYRYDALGRRVDRSFVAQGEVASQQVFHVHDGAREVEELDAVGNVQADFVWGGMYVDELVQLRRGGQTYYSHSSSIYSVVALSDAAGNAVERYAYKSIYGVCQVQDGAGAPRSAAAEVGNPWRFQGRRFDPETGWYHFRARCLDPARGRFVSRDPLGLWGDAGNLGNGYAYAGNDPVNGVDPQGADGDEDPFAALDDVQETTGSLLGDDYLETRMRIRPGPRGRGTRPMGPGFTPLTTDQMELMLPGWGGVAALRNLWRVETENMRAGLEGRVGPSKDMRLGAALDAGLAVMGAAPAIAPVVTGGRRLVKLARAPSRLVLSEASGVALPWRSGSEDALPLLSGGRGGEVVPVVVIVRPRGWFGLRLRFNTIMDKSVGTLVGQRTTLAEVASKPGLYKYVVDAEGRLWLAPGGTPGSHASLVAEGASVRVSGILEITEEGLVSANTISGHFMQRLPLGCGEVAVWQAEMRQAIEAAGLKVFELSPLAPLF